VGIQLKPDHSIANTGAILVELNVIDDLVFYRCLQKLARSFLQQLFEKRLFFIFSSLIKRDHFISVTGVSFLFGASGEAAGVSFFLMRGCAFSHLFIHNFRLYLFPDSFGSMG
jgi:hypothetical protein